MKTKLKIMKRKPSISDDEIERFMNFDKLVKQRDGVVNAKLKKFYILRGSALLVAIALVWGIRIYFKNENTEQVINDHQTSLPEVKEPVQSATDVPSKSNLTEAIAEHKGVQRKDSSFERESRKTIKNEDPIHTSHADKTSYQPVYIQAEPIDGYQALYEYFNRELVYPSSELKDSIQGIVTVIVTINTSGKPEKIRTENSLGRPFDDEALRVIENMPPWKPALLNGKPVASTISVPLTFQLKKLKRK